MKIVKNIQFSSLQFISFRIASVSHPSPYTLPFLFNISVICEAYMTQVNSAMASYIILSYPITLVCHRKQTGYLLPRYSNNTSSLKLVRFIPFFTMFDYREIILFHHREIHFLFDKDCSSTGKTVISTNG